MRNVQAFDTSQLDFDVWGLPEVAYSGGDVKKFKHSVRATFSDVEKFVVDNEDEEIETLAQYKISLILPAIELLRAKIEKEFLDDIDFFRCEESIVQLVRIPISFMDNAPGDVGISFDIITERRLGTLRELEELDE